MNGAVTVSTAPWKAFAWLPSGTSQAPTNSSTVSTKVNCTELTLMKSGYSTPAAFHFPWFFCRWSRATSSTAPNMKTKNAPLGCPFWKLMFASSTMPTGTIASQALCQR